MTESNNQTVVVTGASGGMGWGTCMVLVAQGWQVLAIDCNPERLAELAGQSAAITPVLADLRSEALTLLVDQALAGMPPLAGLVNMAGVSRGNDIDRLEDEDWDESFAINVTPAMRLTRALAPRMRANGRGSVVNVGSPVGIIGARKTSYAASKAALLGLTMSCARNLGRENIRVNLLLPGPTITLMTEDWSEERRQSVAEGSFLGRLCQAEEVGNVVGFLLGPASSYLTGSVLDMTAGSMWGH